MILLTRSILKRLKFSDNRFLFLFSTSPWFRRGFALCLIIAIGVPLTTVKLLNSTPPGTNTQYMISVIDWLQAQALARTARTMDENADPEQRFINWRMAIGNNPGSLDLNRSYLKALITYDTQRKSWQSAIRTSLWLQELSRTNLIDLELSCRTFEYYHFNHMVINSVKAYEGSPSPVLEQSYLRALFRTGQLEDFRTHWQQATAKTRESPSLELYRAASDATSDRQNVAEKGQAILDEAKRSLDTGELAHRLQLRVSHERGDLPSFTASWTHLTENFADITADHLLYWDLLRQLGRVEEAKAAAQDYVHRPRTSHEAIEIADAFTKLGLGKIASRYLKAHAAESGSTSESNWQAQAEHLIYEKQWGDLVGLALDIRTSKTVSSHMMAFSYFIEGVGEFERNRLAAAAEAFAQIKEFSMVESKFGLYIGANLWELGYPEVAYAVLWPEQERYQNRYTYWELLFDISLALRRQEPMFIAAENLYRLNPDSMRYKANYASLLISQRIQLEKALALTFEAYTKYPNNIPVRVNYGQALLLNDREQEARDVFGTVDERNLNTTQRQGYYSALTELLFREGKYQEAQVVAQEVIPDLLLPGDRFFFEAIFDKLAVELDDQIESDAEAKSDSEA
ncbi:MAG: hypothetical protein M2R45_04497 [Verrucomicrobia subdivision 3 bacterium]|nr:hypothetical protein [Limisphaerales bacterium]MCS1412659.1 hypothetical protein [Limisphaerales bacterium]